MQLKQTTRTRKKFYEAADDIRYRGPLSYRHLKILGWICLILAQVVTFAALAQQLMGDMFRFPAFLSEVLSVIGELAVPLFLLANFALILNTQDGYKKLILKYVLLSVLMIALFMLLFGYYISGAVHALLASAGTADETLNEIVKLLAPHGYMECNLFLDLLLCTLFMYFLNAKPKRVFTGKKLLIFRLFAILPVAYEAVCLTVKILVANGRLVISPYLFPLLTTKPPVAFLLFLALALFLKLRERRFLRHGNTPEAYEAFLKTNRNSLHFSAFTAVVLVVASLLDLVLVFLLTRAVASNPAVELEEAMEIVGSWGFGHSFPMIFLAPIMLLFSYTRSYEKNTVDLVIPAAGLLGLVLVILEAVYLLVCNLPAILA